MKIATSTNILFERTNESLVPVIKCLEYSYNAGFRFIDFGFMEHSLVSNTFHTKDWKDEILECKEYADAHGMEFVQAHATIFDFTAKAEDYTRQQTLFERSLIGASMLDVKWIAAHPVSNIIDGRLSSDTRRMNIDFFNKYSQFADNLGVGIAIENMWGTTSEGIPRYAVNANELLTLIEDINCENVKICWDIEHASVENLDQYTSITLLGHHIAAIHISDENGKDNIHILPFTGKLDWDAALDGLAEINFSGCLDLEIQHYLRDMPWPLVPEAMKFSYEIGRYLIEQLERKMRKIMVNKHF